MKSRRPSLGIAGPQQTEQRKWTGCVVHRDDKTPRTEVSSLKEANAPGSRYKQIKSKHITVTDVRDKPRVLIRSEGGRVLSKVPRIRVQSYDVGSQGKEK